MLKENWTFENVFKAVNFTLRGNGSHPAIALDIRWIIKNFITIPVSLACLYMLTNSVINHRLPQANYTDVVRESIMAVVAFTILCKYSLILRYRTTVLNLIRYMDDDYELATEFPEEEKDIVYKYIKRGVNVIYFWLACAVSSGMIFAAKALILTIYFHIKGEDKYFQVFDMVFPAIAENHKNELVGYCLLSTVLLTFDVFAVMVYIGFEPLIPIFMLHCCGQLEILSIRAENIFSETKTIDRTLQELKNINKKLQTIYKFVDDVQKTFVPLSEFTMKTTTLLMPFIAFHIIESLQRHEIHVEFMTLMCACILQFFLPCYYSDLLMEKSECLRQAIYSCGWDTHPCPQIRSTVLFMLSRTRKPVVLRTFFYPLCLETFSEVCHQAYAIYNIMRAAWC